MTSTTVGRSAVLLHRLTVVTLVNLVRRFSATSRVDSAVDIISGLQSLGSIFSFSKSTLAFGAPGGPSPVVDRLLHSVRDGRCSFTAAEHRAAADVDR